jgi:hypothetical protein
MFSILQHNSLLLDDESQNLTFETNAIFVDQLQFLTLGEAEPGYPGGVIELEPNGEVHTYGNIKTADTGFKPAIFELISRHQTDVCVTFPKTIHCGWIEKNPAWDFRFEWILGQKTDSLNLNMEAGKSIFIEVGIRLMISSIFQQKRLLGTTVPFDIKTNLI